MPVSKSPPLSKIAAHLGISKTRAVELKQQGMPVTNLRAAKLWRDSQIKKREATNAKSAKVQAAGKAGRPRKLTRSKPAKSGDSLADSLTDAITIAQDAFDAYQDAKMSRPQEMSARLSEFNKALAGRQNAERLHREELQARSILVPRAAIVESCRRSMDAMLRRLKKLPSETGPQCGGLEPLQIVTVLQKAVDEILLAGNRAMTSL